MSEKKEQLIVLNWPAVVYKITVGIFWLLFLIIFIVGYNYKDMFEIWKSEFAPVQCVSVVNKEPAES